jgi:hypothetical protein
MAKKIKTVSTATFSCGKTMTHTGKPYSHAWLVTAGHQKVGGHAGSRELALKAARSMQAYNEKWGEHKGSTFEIVETKTKEIK